MHAYVEAGGRNPQNFIKKKLKKNIQVATQTILHCGMFPTAEAGPGAEVLFNIPEFVYSLFL